MTRILIISCIIVCVISLMQTRVQGQAIDIPYGNSPAAKVSQTIGLTEIEVSYSRPRVILDGQDNTGHIWGEQVAYGFNKVAFAYEQEIPWTAGQNHNTTISFEHDVKINGQALKAGAYGFYMAVYEDGKVTLIFSSNSNSWESFWYHPDNDVLRVDVRMEDAPFTNSLTYSFDDIEADKCELALSWEHKRIPFQIEVDVHAIALASFEEELKGTVGFGSEGPAAAAQYLLDEGVYLEQALIYAQWAINNGRTPANLILKTSLLLKTGEEKESAKLLEEIAEEANAWQLYFLSKDMITYNKPQEAREILKRTLKRNAEQAVAHLALGEAYEANGQFELAIKSAQKALTLEPNPFVKSGSEKLIEDLEARM